MVSLHLLRKEDPRGGWHDFPVHTGSHRDRLAEPWLAKWVTGGAPINSARLVLDRADGKILLQVGIERAAAPLSTTGRVATLSVEDGEQDAGIAQLTLRAPKGVVLHLTHELHAFFRMKDNFEEMRRRLCIQIGKGKGAVHKKRRLLRKLDLAAWSRTHWQTVAKKVATFALANGCSEIRIMDILPGAWPAHAFTSYLTSRAQQDGIKVTEARAEDQPQDTEERAALAALRRERTLNAILKRAVRAAVVAGFEPSELGKMVTERAQNLTDNWQSRGEKQSGSEEE